MKFQGPNGAKVAYDAPHSHPGLGYDTPHVGYRVGKGRNYKRGNITYGGKQHPYRSGKKGGGIIE